MEVKFLQCWYIQPNNTVDKLSILTYQLVTATSFQMLLLQQVVDHQFELAGCLGTAGGNAHGIQAS